MTGKPMTMNKPGWPPSTAQLLCLTIVASVGAGPACYSTTPYVSTTLKSPVRLKSSQTHAFHDVSIEQEGGTLVVFGKLSHQHRYCTDEGHIDLAVISPARRVLLSTSLPAGWSLPTLAQRCIAGPDLGCQRCPAGRLRHHVG